MQLATAKSQKKSSLHLVAKARRLKADLKAEKQETSAVKSEEDEAKTKELDVEEKTDQQIQKAENKEHAIEVKAVARAEERGKEKIAAAKESLRTATEELGSAKKKSEESASVAGGVVKMCKSVDPPNADSEDETAVCKVVLQEQHCTFFDYARYCAKSCGICIL